MQDAASYEGHVIEVDFKRRRRVKPHESQTLVIMSYIHEREGPVPQSLRFGQKVLLIWEILDRWPAQDYRYYKVRTVDDVVIFLRHSVREDRWSLIT